MTLVLSNRLDEENRTEVNRAALTPEARKAFDALVRQAVVFAATVRWAIDPENSMEYNAQRVLDYAHGCVDLAHEFKRALTAAAATAR